MLNPKYIFYILLVVVTLLGGWRFWYLEKQQITKDFVVAQKDVVAEVKAKDEVAVNKLDVRYQEVVKVEIKYVDRIVTKKVIGYRDRVVNRCILDPEWVLTYNLSTQQPGGPNTTGRMDGEAGGARRDTN